MLPHGAALGAFVTSAVVLLLIPGPAVFYIIGRSLGQGRAAGLVSVCGISVGTLFHVLAATLGLSAVLASSAAAFQTVKYLGAAYLVFLGVQKLMHREPEKLGEADVERVRLRRVFGQGVVVNILNPKSALFFLAFLPQFVTPGRGNMREQILSLGLLFTSMGILSDGMWAMLAGTLAELMKKKKNWLNAQRYFSGGLLITLGLATAFTGSNRAK
jgi:threonine/homoserine/homoserine lactone efflux protein